MNEAQWWLALSGAFLTGGVGLEVLRRLWPSRQQRVEAEASLRDDLMRELGALRARVDALDRDLGEWKDRYYALLSDYTTLKAEVEVLRVRVSKAETREVG